jgi:hypothetical protein
MPLFVAEHSHAPEKCPAADPQMGNMLLGHLSSANAANYDVTLYIILEAPDRERVMQFMAPFAQAGIVEVHGASPCEAVVGRGGCSAILQSAG